jgi:hypothetical protein
MRRGGDGIRAGLVGRTLRLLVGLALVVEGGRHLIGGDAPLWLATSGVIVGEVGLYAALHLLIVRLFGGANPWIGAVVAVLPVAVIYLVSDAPGRLGTILFVGISLVATAWRADGRCEVMTLPGMIFGKRTHLVCLAFSPVDWAERTWTEGARRKTTEKGDDD